MVNATEKGQDLQLSGTSNQPDGTTITVTLNGINYTAITDGKRQLERHRSGLCRFCAG
ncbi:type 1 secretion target domain-containng protein [Enterobacter cancerogenus]|uniref:Type 1 secretion target domain-containng protein n=1 Tax=Enterobacter cancerogenus TaxID=69218 RepID=A0A484YXW6_9ENTR|nr:type 1 secretion target domain-containng protein [Enterobacter cancerogenus]